MDEDEYRLKARDACRRATAELDKAVKKLDEKKEESDMEVDQPSAEGHEEKMKND
jgi:hypothetical protein